MIKKKTVNLAKFCLKTTHQDQDETETRRSKIEANKTRLSQKFYLRRDRDETSSKILFETETRPRVSVPLVLRPRLDRDSRPLLQLSMSMFKGFIIDVSCLLSNELIYVAQVVVG